MNLKIRNSLLLLLTAAIWGVAFVAQDEGMDYLRPFTFNAVRSLIGAIVLLPVIFARDGGIKREKWGDKNLLLGGVLCGAALCTATQLQQYGILYSDESVGKAGFITACYIILVPIAGLFFKKRCGALVYLAVAVAAVGLYLLCIPQGEAFSVAAPDILLFGCSLVFTVQILLVDHFSPIVDGVKLACIQFATSGAISLILALIFDDISIPAIFAAWLPVLYAGVFSCGVAYTLQIIAQNGLNPTLASIIMSFESCISVLAAWIIQDKAMSARQISGCAIMFAAIILAQIRVKKTDKTEREKVA